MGHPQCMPKDSLEYREWYQKTVGKHPSKNPSQKKEWIVAISKSRKGQPSGFKGKTFPEASKRILSEKIKELWNQPSYRSRVINSLRENPALHKAKSDETRKKMSIAQKKRFKDPIQIEVLRERANRMWADPEFRDRWRVGYQKALDEGRIGTWAGIRAGRNRPNKLELKMLNILDTHFSDSWKYTGDASLIINGFQDGSTFYITTDYTDTLRAYVIT